MSENRLFKLKDLLKNAVELAQNKSLNQEDLNKIRELWEEQENCLKETANMGDPTVLEMLVDLKIIETTGCYLGQYINQLQTSATVFNPSDYAQKLLAKISNDGEIDWWKMSNDAIRIINRAPGISMLLGTFKSTTTDEVKTLQERKRKVVVRAPKEIPAEKQTPSQMEFVEEDKNTDDAKVKYILKTLKNYYKQNSCQPVNFYKFAIHPQNFTTTVENIFYISFIIRDGLASLDTIQDELVIVPIEKQENEKRENETNKRQMVFSITMDEWKAWVNEYNIRVPIIQ